MLATPLLLVFISSSARRFDSMLRVLRGRVASFLAPNRSYFPQLSYDANCALLRREVDILSSHKLAVEEEEHCRRSFELIIRTLSGPDLDARHVSLIHKVLEAVGKRALYHEGAFNYLSNFFLNTSSEVGMSKILPHFVNLCENRGYYNEELLQRCAQYATENLHKLTDNHILSIVRGLALMCCPNNAFATVVEEHLMNSRKFDEYSGNYLPWTLALYGMVHRHYPVRVLEKILTDDYIRGMKGP